MCEPEYIVGIAEPGSLLTQIFAGAVADTPCGELLSINKSGVWTCEREHGHDGAHWATGTVEV